MDIHEFKDLLEKCLEGSATPEEESCVVEAAHASEECARILWDTVSFDASLHACRGNESMFVQKVMAVITRRDLSKNFAPDMRRRLEKNGRPATVWFPRWGWAASVAAMLLISVLVYAYTKFSTSGKAIQSLQLTASVGPNSEVHLKWTDVFDSEEGFQIERSFDGMMYGEIARVASGVESYKDTGAQKAAIGYYRVRAFSHSGFSNYSNTASVSLLTPPGISISARGHVGKGYEVLVTGIVITGSESKKVLIHTMGPLLVDAGVPDVLVNPVVSLRTGGKTIARNDNWQEYDPLGEQNGYVCGKPEEIKAIGLVPSGTSHQLESAIMITLPPGLYTADVQGVDDTTGMTLVEILEVK